LHKPWALVVHLDRPAGPADEGVALRDAIMSTSASASSPPSEGCGSCFVVAASALSSP
jgi:hypothetical protein